MANNLENRAKHPKIKQWELIVPLIGSIAYPIRCGKHPESSRMEYSDEIMSKTVGLVVKDIFLTMGAGILYELIMK